MLNERFSGPAPVARAHGAAVFAGPVMGIAACLAHPEFSRVAEWLKPTQTASQGRQSSLPAMKIGGIHLYLLECLGWRIATSAQWHLESRTSHA